MKQSTFSQQQRIPSIVIYWLAQPKPDVTSVKSYILLTTSTTHILTDTYTRTSYNTTISAHHTMALPDSSSPIKPTPLSDECWSDTDYFVKTLTRIQGEGARPELIGSIITHYASKWLPDLAGDESVSSKKRSFIETLVGLLPQEKDSVPCNFLLRILRVANMVGAEAGCRAELEQRVSWQLDQASLREVMIPCCRSSLLDFELFLRLVKRFVTVEEVARSGGALMKVAKLVDTYLAEAAAHSHFSFSHFVALATALPSHARSTDDGIYCAIDIYLKAHPGLSKQERKGLCMLIESRKLSREASIHAAQNERLPVRAVIQVLLSEQDKLSRNIEWSGSLCAARSPGIGLDATARSLSRRGMTMQQMEIKRLKEDVLLLQSQCMSMERQLEKLLEKKRGYFSWKKLAIRQFKPDKIGEVEGDAGGVRMATPMQMKARLVGGRSSNKWRSELV